MGLFDGLFQKEKKLVDLRSPGQKDLGEQFLGSLGRGISGFTPGQAAPINLTTQATDLEQQGLNRLGQFGDSSIRNNEAFGAGRGNILSTLSGDFLDVTKSPQFTAFQNELARSKQNAIDDARRASAARGDFRSTGSARIESDIALDAANQQASVLAQLFNQERNRQSQAAQQALQVGQFEQQEPLAQAQALTQIGALPRLIEESNIARQLSDFNRVRGEQLGALSAAGSASNEGGPRLGLDTAQQTTGLGQLANLAAPILGIAAGTGGLSSGLGNLSGLLSNFFRQPAGGVPGVDATNLLAPIAL